MGASVAVHRPHRHPVYCCSRRRGLAGYAEYWKSLRKFASWTARSHSLAGWSSWSCCHCYPISIHPCAREMSAASSAPWTASVPGSGHCFHARYSRRATLSPDARPPRECSPSQSLCCSLRRSSCGIGHSGSDWRSFYPDCCVSVPFCH